MITRQVGWMMAAMVVGLGVGLHVAADEDPPAAPGAPAMTEVLDAVVTEAVEALEPAPTAEKPDHGILALTLRAEFAHKKVLAERESETYLDLRVDAWDGQAEVRPRLNVALVLDRSGSMAGEPMAKARQAAASFVERLEEGDRVSVIAFGGAPEVVVVPTAIEGATRARVIAAIEGIDSGGATHLSGGIEAASGALRGARQSDSVDRMIVMTDGLPTTGITATEELLALARQARAEGITVTALGFGTSYDASLMASLAEEGAGNYRYIAGTADVEPAFSAELDALAATVATGVTLTLLPSPGVHIEEVFGMPADPSAGALTLHLGDLRAETRRRVMLRLKTRGLPLDGQARVRVILNYHDRITDRPVEHGMVATAGTTHDDVEMVASLRPEVMARVQEALATRALSEATEAYARGDQEGATRHLENERRRMRRASADYGLAKEEMAPMAAEVDALKARMGSAAPSSAAGKALRFERSQRDLELKRGEATPGAW
ncbi:hypothetical protein DL240_11740 [Lujinxingia litoralis]|uniref:VWFA domain-containing protein n=1 Tax=Lujinxingia litoralis TaxID=2211119 RepID=A0A328C7B3_9DELT|nr:VWA domain-containing protein [Lujinxingia litoralis]RAL21528.1 hypothetical protein DL240_11740 [Lujinxingia litoralis]